jgi:hypothetical protein
MSTTTSFADLKAKSASIISSGDAAIKNAAASITKLEKKVPRIDAAITKLNTDAIALQDSQKNLQASIEFPEMHADAKQLNEALFKARFYEHAYKQEKADKERYMKKFSDVNLEAYKLARDKKLLVQTVAKQQLDYDEMRTEVQEYFIESAASYARREAGHEAYAAELEELLDYKRNEQRAAVSKLENMADSSALWSN